MSNPFFFEDFLVELLTLFVGSKPFFPDFTFFNFGTTGFLLSKSSLMLDSFAISEASKGLKGFLASGHPSSFDPGSELLLFLMPLSKDTVQLFCCGAVDVGKVDGVAAAGCERSGGGWLDKATAAPKLISAKSTGLVGSCIFPRLLAKLLAKLFPAGVEAVDLRSAFSSTPELAIDHDEGCDRSPANCELALEAVAKAVSAAESCCALPLLLFDFFFPSDFPATSEVSCSLCCRIPPEGGVKDCVVEDEAVVLAVVVIAAAAVTAAALAVDIRAC